MKCSNCGGIISSDMKFCISCGADVIKQMEEEETQFLDQLTKCNTCGINVTEEMKFCINCGATLNQSNEKEEESIKIEQPIKKNKVKKEKKSVNKSGINKTKIVLLVLVLVILFTAFIFRKNMLYYGYEKMAIKCENSDFNKAVEWGKKAYDINSESQILGGIYSKEAEKLIDKDPNTAIEYLLQAKRYTDSEEYDSLLADAYIKYAKEKAKSAPNTAIKQIEKAMKLDFKDEMIDQYVDLLIVKSKDDFDEDISISHLKEILNSDNYKKLEAKLTKANLGNSLSLTITEEPAYDYDLLDFTKQTSNYIFPESSIRQLTYQDLVGLDSWILRLGRNEIYARHGYIFNTPEISQYFSTMPWYSPNDNFNETSLNEIEKYNARFIKDYE